MSNAPATIGREPFAVVFGWLAEGRALPETGDYSAETALWRALGGERDPHAAEMQLHRLQFERAERRKRV